MLKLLKNGSVQRVPPPCLDHTAAAVARPTRARLAAAPAPPGWLKHEPQMFVCWGSPTPRQAVAAPPLPAAAGAAGPVAADAAPTATVLNCFDSQGSPSPAKRRRMAAEQPAGHSRSAPSSAMAAAAAAAAAPPASLPPASPLLRQFAPPDVQQAASAVPSPCRAVPGVARHLLFSRPAPVPLPAGLGAAPAPILAADVGGDRQLDAAVPAAGDSAAFGPAVLLGSRAAAYAAAGPVDTRSNGDHASAASPTRAPAAAQPTQSPAVVGQGSDTTLQYADKLLQVTDPARNDRPALFASIDTPGAPVQLQSALPCKNPQQGWHDCHPALLCMCCIMPAAAS